MSSNDVKYCPICTTQELTAATKVYPLCQCKLSMCFDCLRKWVKMRYSCPFCNIPFSQNTFRQTKEELRMRLCGNVAPNLLDQIVEAWVTQLSEMRSEMEVGLAILDMDSDDLTLTLGRARTPLRSLYPYSSSSSYLLNLMPPMLSSNVSFQTSTSVVQPDLSPMQNMGLSSPGANGLGAWHVNITPRLVTNRVNDDDAEVGLGFNLSLDTRSVDGQFVANPRESQWSPSISSTCTSRFNDFVGNQGGRMRSILEKRLYVRELVNIHPNTCLAKKLKPNSFGVVMRYTGELRSGADDELIWEENRPIFLTVRLSDGSWLTRLRVEDVEARFKRATLCQWLRVGDVLWTRYGVAMTVELHPKSRQVTVRYLRGLNYFKEQCNINNVDEIYKIIKTVCGFSARIWPEDQDTPSMVPKNEISNESKETTKNTYAMISTSEKKEVMEEEKSDHFDIKERKDKVFKTDDLGHCSSSRYFNNPLFGQSAVVSKSKSGDGASGVISDTPGPQSLSISEYETKRIYEGDIQTVFTAQEVFEVIQMKIAEELTASQYESSQGSRVKGKCKSTIGFLKDGYRSNATQEYNDFPNEPMVHIESMPPSRVSYDDKLISVNSLMVSQNSSILSPEPALQIHFNNPVTTL